MRFLSGGAAQAIIDIRLSTLDDKTYWTIHRHISLVGIDSGCGASGLAATYLDNLARLGLVHIDEIDWISNGEPYKRIENHTQIAEIISKLKETPERKVVVKKGRVFLTDLGHQFIRVCVIDKENQKRG